MLHYSWRKEAQTLVKVGFFASLFAAVMIFLTQHLPAAPFAAEVQQAYEVLLGANLRFVFASMIAYYISQTWDVWIFSKLKEKTEGKHRWLRNNASTMSSQLLDTVIFISIAFIGTPGLNLGLMIVSQYVLKLIIAAADTPVFYLLTNKLKVEVAEQSR
ncbi:MAG: queuosine precursor transporter [Actinobacteria bacterium]|nr:queuosine precursor transporter [Actinomycetota bacterium]